MGVEKALGFGLIGLLICILGTELSLRQWFGFGNPLLYIADDQIGYLLAPNQNVQRFGNQILINQYSMRGDATTPERPADTLRLFLLGDSIANGGWWTAQHQTISALLADQLAASPLAASYQHVEVLNASANSWGPRNELAYLEKFGEFDAQLLILLINTDDLFATAPTSVQVGRDPNYPDHKPPFALSEVIGRYLLKPDPIPELEVVRSEKGDRVGKNLEAIRQIQDRMTASGGELRLVMTPLLREIGSPGPRDYELKARDRLIAFAQAEDIRYLDFLPLFNAHPEPGSLYRDHIHLNADGNRFVVQHLQAIL